MQTDWASENLQVIRTLMERSAVYRRALAPVMGLVGLTGIAAGVLGAALDFNTSRHFAVYWAVVALVCLTESFLLIRRQAVKELEPFWSPPTRRVAQAVAPAFFMGLVVALVLSILNSGQRRCPALPILDGALWIGHACGRVSSCRADSAFSAGDLFCAGWPAFLLGYLLMASDSAPDVSLGQLPTSSWAPSSAEGTRLMGFT